VTAVEHNPVAVETPHVQIGGSDDDRLAVDELRHAFVRITLRRSVFLRLEDPNTIAAGIELRVMTTRDHAGEVASGRKRGPRRWFIGGVLVFALAVAVTAGAAYGYALSQQDVIARGVHVGTVELGGLSEGAARAELEQAFRPLSRPLVLRSDRERLVLTAQRLKLSLGTETMVDRAVAVSERGWFVARAWRELTGGHIDAKLESQLRYSHAAVSRAIHELQKQIDRRPIDAKLVPSFDRLTVMNGQPGIAVAVGPLDREIAHALATVRARRVIDVPVRHPRPRLTIAALRRRYPSFITIDRARFTLRVYGHLRLLRSYPIAVGQVGLQTPAGLYHIQDKVVNPSWQVPFSSWTGSLAGKLIPPGPADPLKARWLGIFNGAGIHGTDETWSIGHAVSHGCVRMTIPEVIDLYDRVSVGTPVYIGD
jgi:lipoprotein-anchoring transpeptidase ErfK/SrfK